jgi:DNA-binding transcriptional regulator PaaX
MRYLKMEKKASKPTLTDVDLKGYRRGELAKEILLMIAAGVAIPAAFVMPNIPFALKPLLKPMMKRCGLRKSESFIRSVTHLKRNRLVSIAEKDGQQILTLSENGKKRVLLFDLQRMTIKKQKRWDGYWRIVIFDIPEGRKQGREALRSKLKQLGFYQLQKSCFIYPYECKSEIDFISEMFEVSPHVNFIVAKEIEGAALLQKFFGLC